MSSIKILSGFGKVVFLLLMCGFSTAKAGVVKGVVKDRQNNEPLVGATVIVSANGRGATADMDGRYDVELPAGTYTITARYMGYKTLVKESVEVPGEGEIILDFLMEGESQILAEVRVTAVARRNTEIAQMQAQKRSLVVQTGVSAQQIARTQDKDASEVIRRVPGVSIIDGKFVMIRGLSQRYNNVWLNGGAVPSSEADSRAFSFDILPSSQLDNIVIVKSPAPEYPADFTGGFILVNTKQQTEDNGFEFSVGMGINDRTHFRRFVASKGSAADWLGFGDGWRSLQAGMNKPLRAYPGYEGGVNPRLDVEANGLNNNWKLHTIHPVGDLKLNLSGRHTWKRADGSAWGLLASMNYSNTHRTYRNMENSLYGPYDISNDKPVALRKATDNRYSNDVRLGALLNLSFRPKDSRHYFEWKNLFNQMANNRYAERRGFNAQPDNINDMEYHYAARTTCNTQFTGRHTLKNDHIDWSIGYAYADRHMPDRRLIERNDRMNRRMGIYRISREFTSLNEHIASAAVNYRRDFHFGKFEPTLKAGAYSEYRTRSYRSRQFQYGWQPDHSLPEDFLFSEDIPGDVLVGSNYGPDKLYLYEEVNFLNDYEGSQTQFAGYIGLNLPAGAFNVYVGARYEYNRQVLRMNTRQFEQSLKSTAYGSHDVFPSLNMTYRLNDRHQFRLAYGMSVNRPEFRERATSVYYDFELGSSVMGNYNLKSAYINNVDLRYEWYPSGGEQVSVTLFYKHFKNPIEWTYTVAGGTDLVYSFTNARGADNYGIEIDIRKKLDFMGLKNFSLAFNCAWIKSKVRFGAGSNIDRPMQGQSPYLINTGIFYNHEKRGWSAAVLYNRVGKRIVGVGNRYGTGADGSARNIPNSYEMPRNSLDLSVGKKIGKWELKFSVRDVLAEACVFKQFEKVVVDGQKRTIKEVTRRYRPGRDFILTVAYAF